MKRIIGFGAVLTAVAVSGWMLLGRADTPVGAATVPAAATVAGDSTAVVTLAVSGMTCSTCPITVKRALARVAGVSDVEVSLDTHEAIVTYDHTRASVAALISATTNAGFPSAVR